MKCLSFLVNLGLAAAAATNAYAAGAASCDLSSITSAAKLHEALGMRAVEVVKRAMRVGWASDPRLAKLVAADAPARLGAGDVGRPFGEGPGAFHAMAADMHADNYRFLGWDMMDAAVAPCEVQKVSVEFADTATQQLSRVEFTFKGGRVVSAAGWEWSYSAGSLK